MSPRGKRSPKFTLGYDFSNDANAATNDEEEVKREPAKDIYKILNGKKNHLHVARMDSFELDGPRELVPVNTLDE